MRMWTRLRSWMHFDNVRPTAERFAFPLGCMALIALLSLWQLYATTAQEDNFMRVIAWLYITATAGVVINLYAESHQKSRRFTILLSALVLIVVALLTFTPLKETTGFVQLIFGTTLLMTVVPHLGRRDDLVCCHDNCTILISGFMAWLAVTILCGGISAVLATLDYLFGMPIDTKLYATVWIIGAALLWPLWTLAGFPHYDRPGSYTDYPKAIRFILSRIVVPLLLVYLLILYAYAVKILLAGSLPKGQLTYMMCAFGLAGVASYCLTVPLANRGHWLINILQHWFFPLLLGPLALMWYAIWLRVNAYGITEERYLAMLAALWLTFSALFMIATHRRSFKPVVLTAAILLLLGSFGPWGSRQVSIRSQLLELQTLLETQGVLVDGRIVKDKEVSRETAQRASSIVDYLNSHHRIHEIAHWTEEKSYLRAAHPNLYVSSHHIMQDLGMEYVGRWDHARRDGDYFHYNQAMGTWQNSLYDIRGFDYISEIQTLNEPIFLGKDVKVERTNTVITVTAGADHIAFDLASRLAALKQERGSQEPVMEPLIFEETSGSLRVRMVIRNLSGTRDGTKIKLNYVNFVLFIKR